MVTVCLPCGVATAVGEEMGSMGLPSLDQAPRGRGKHRLSARLSSGGDADTDETFGCLHSGLVAVGLSTHAIEAYRDFLKAHSGKGHGLRWWAEEHEDLPKGARKPKCRWYKAPRRAPGFVRARVRFSCAKCSEVFESAGVEWVRPFEARDLTKGQVQRLVTRTLRPSEFNIHDAWPFEIVLFDDLDDWFRSHGAHPLRIELVPESAPAAVRDAAPVSEPWTPPPTPPEGDDRTLGPISPEALPLLARLHHRDPRERESAAHALASLAEPGTLGHLAAELDDPDAGVRVAVVGALGALQDPRAIRPLGVALLDEAPGVREAARRALGQTQVDAADALRRARTPRGPADSKTEGAGNSGQPAVIDAVDPRPSHRGAAAGKLRASGDAALVIALLTDYSSHVVAQAAVAAGDLRLREAVSPLCAAAQTVALGPTREPCFRAILIALGKIGDPAGVPVLRSALDHRDSSIRDQARAGLALIQGEPAP